MLFVVSKALVLQKAHLPKWSRIWAGLPKLLIHRYVIGSLGIPAITNTDGGTTKGL